MARLVEAQVARGVPWGPDGGQVPAGNLGRVAVLHQDVRRDRPHVAPYRHRRLLQRGHLLLRRAVPAQHGGHALQQGLGLVVALLDQSGVGRMERDPSSGGLADASGQAVVVRVDVGDQNPLHVGDRLPRLLQPCHQGLIGVVGVPAGVDQVRAAIGLERVDEHVAQRVVGDRDRDAPEAGPHQLDGGEGQVAGGVVGHGLQLASRRRRPRPPPRKRRLRSPVCPPVRSVACPARSGRRAVRGRAVPHPRRRSGLGAAACG